MTIDAPPLNVLFITADQWRGDCLSAAGHPMVRTPHLDSLAAEGVLFARHYANTAPCGPSRASLHTGLYLQNHRSHANGTPLDGRHTNWALESAALGYDPVLFGYTDTSVDPRGVAADDPRLHTYEGPLPGIRPVCALDGRPQPWTDWLNAQGYETPADIGQAYGHRANGREYEDGAAHPRPLAYPAEVDDTAFLVGRLVEYLKAASGPFVAHLSLLRPHPPFVAPEPYNALYDPTAVSPFARRESPEAEGAQHPWLAWRLSQRQFRATANERRLRRLKAVYYGLISRVDAEIGVLMAFLRRSGLIDRTMIIFTSDHGEQMGDHWLLGKGGYFEGSYHIPLIIRDPRRGTDGGRGGRVSHFTENVDIMPTLIEAIGGEIPRQCDGSSLAPFLIGAGAPAAWRTAAHWEYDFRDDAAAAAGEHDLTPDQCAMNILRGERFKYVHFARLPPLLFDLVQDPDEMHDLAGDPAHAGAMLASAQALLSWRMIHDERTLTHLRLTEHGVVAEASARS
ncbi:MAG TPA: alkaline phosphatase family protein [Caulobacteraceae bacterium]|nr:alkaline phosphatase family protein [Caulobacteraceae bacterium]